MLVFYNIHIKLPPTGWLKQYKFILTWFWKPEVWKQGVSRSAFPQGALGESSFLVSFSEELEGVYANDLYLVA